MQKGKTLQNIDVKEDNNAMSELKSEVITLVYDGECPFCNHYARYMRLKETAGELLLINAREAENPVVMDIKKRGFDLDQGMVTIIDEQYYHGQEALNVLAVLSSKSGLFNRLNYHLFKSERCAKVAYPFLRAGRNMILKVKGVSLIKLDE